MHCVECFHSNANITLIRHIPAHGEVTSVNYTIARDSQEFVPVTIEIDHGGEFTSFRCSNGRILDTGGTAIGEVMFKGYCKDPTVLVNNGVSVSVSLDLTVILSDVDRACSSVTIVPQSEYNNAACTIFTRIPAKCLATPKILLQ